MIASKADGVNLPVAKDRLAFILVTQCGNVTVIVSERKTIDEVTEENQYNVLECKE
jgi:hypothetical protein